MGGHGRWAKNQLVNGITRAIDSIHRLIDGISGLINSIIRLVDGLTRLINGITGLINGWGPRGPGRASQPIISHEIVLINKKYN